jgi:hypothetical protein
MFLSSLPSLSRALLDCLRAWWLVDRIRASPRDGRLLRLHPPCVIAIGGQIFEIAHRIVGQDAGGPFVVYDCHYPYGPAQLLVRLHAGCSRLLVRWIGPDGERSLDEEAISVFEST